MIAVIKILLFATTAVNQACTVTSPCAGTAAHVSERWTFVIVELSAVMVLMNQTHILIEIIAQRRTVCPAQVILGTVESSVMAVPPVQISGTNYSPPANRLFIKLCHWLPKVPFFLKMAIFVNLEVPFFYLK